MGADRFVGMSFVRIQFLFREGSNIFSPLNLYWGPFPSETAERFAPLLDRYANNSELGEHTVIKVIELSVDEATSIDWVIRSDLSAPEVADDLLEYAIKRYNEIAKAGEDPGFRAELELLVERDAADEAA